MYTYHHLSVSTWLSSSPGVNVRTEEAVPRILRDTERMSICCVPTLVSVGPTQPTLV